MVRNDPVAFPDELRKREASLIACRRGRKGEIVEPEEAVGFGLSGGGIRSATFCLGVFQSLAKQRLLRHVDYLSTVSGGGYFGSFLGRLFTRGTAPARTQATADGSVSSVATSGRSSKALGGTAANENSPEPVVPQAEAAAVRDAGSELSIGSACDVEAILDNERARGVLRALRANGRYLSPSGGGDLLLAGAVLLRNWLALQVVLLVTLLAGLAWIEALRALCASSFPDLLATLETRLNPSDGFFAGRVYWSALIALAPASFAWFALPSGVAYWMPRSRWEPALAIASIFGAAWLYLQGGPNSGWAYFAGGAALSFALTCVALVLARWQGRKHVRSSMPASAEEDTRTLPNLEVESSLRSLLSRWFSAGLWLSVGVLAVGVVDSIGRTIYALIQLDRFDDWRTWLASGATALLSGGLGARTVSIIFAKRPSDSRVRMPTAMLATLGAVAVGSFMLITASVGVQALSWNFGKPARADELVIPQEIVVHWSSASLSKDSKLEFRETRPSPAALPVAGVQATAADGPAAQVKAERGEPVDIAATAAVLRRHVVGALLWSLALTFLASLLGCSQRFLVLSSHHPLYSARLTRAYLGASNPNRIFGNNDMTEVVAGDDVSLDEYYPSAEGEPGAIGRGAPLHFINVTINETVDGETKLQQQDRRGTGMALGPCGLSVGTRHHATFWWRDVADTASPEKDNAGAIEWSRPADPGAEHAVFPSVARFYPEQLSLGRWVSISGAAFSTGLGARTSFALSLLAGVFNIRLGHWWNPRLRAPSWFDRVSIAQRYLARELFARFPGTSRPRWYLSDGGHFENMGGYELVRRRLTKIVIVDAEADPDYTFAGLADFVRKARLDFGAEIVFKTAEELDALVDPSVRAYIGTLADLRRLDEATKQPDRARPSLAHAALASVHYRSGSCGTLLYVKPTLLGPESADLVHYHATHSDFPQETTGDQFFDEAQWESYRKLGMHIGDLLFHDRQKQAGRFLPRDLCVLPAGALGVAGTDVRAAE